MVAAKDAAASYSVNLNACHEMEAEIKRRGLVRQYTEAFAGMFDAGLICQSDDQHEFGFQLIHLDALTRCKAALLCVMEESKNA